MNIYTCGNSYIQELYIQKLSLILQVNRDKKVGISVFEIGGKQTFSIKPIFLRIFHFYFFFLFFVSLD